MRTGKHGRPFFNICTGLSSLLLHILNGLSSQVWITQIYFGNKTMKIICTVSACLSVCASMHICVSLSCYLEASTVLVVSCPDPTLSQGKGSGDYWAISWLCRLSSIDFWM